MTPELARLVDPAAATRPPLKVKSRATGQSRGHTSVTPDLARLLLLLLLFPPAGSPLCSRLALEGSVA